MKHLGHNEFTFEDVSDEILSGIPRGEDDNIAANGLRVFLPAHGGICEGVRGGLASVVARLHTSLPLACPASTVLVLPWAIAPNISSLTPAMRVALPQ